MSPMSPSSFQAQRLLQKRLAKSNYLSVSKKSSLLALVTTILLTSHAFCEIRLRAVWQEFIARASAGNGLSDQHSSQTGSSSVPGGRTMSRTATAPVPPGPPFTRAVATARQTASLLTDGFDVAGFVSSSETGVYPVSQTRAQLVMEIEITEQETYKIDFSKHIVTNYNHPVNPGVTLEFNRWSEIGWNGGVPQYLNGTDFESTIQPGIYRMKIGADVVMSSYEDSSQSTDFAYQVSFSNFVILPGSLQSHPILPDVSQTFTNVRTNRWYDPPAADGFSFVASGETTFEEIVALPLGFNTTFHIYVGGVKVGESMGGESFSFKDTLGLAVSSFEIRNILPYVDAESPTAFPIMLRFTEETGTFTMTPIAATFAQVAALPAGDIRIDFQGILQKSESLDFNDWSDLNPQPFSPLLIPRSSLRPREFFRVRLPSP